MPLTRPAPQETREMRLFSKLLEHRSGEALPTFIAKRRSPGETYESWDGLVFAIGEATGELVSDVTLRQWAKRYGIPEDSKADGDSEAYAANLAAANITI